MSSPRFYVPRDAIEGKTLVLPDGAARQTRVVLRLRPGDSVIVFDGGDSEWPVTLSRVDSNGVEGTIGEPNFPGTEPTCGVTIMQALIKPDRFEQVLQKGTELGVRKFIPLKSARVQPADASAASKSRFERWRRIVREAAEQSGRLTVPQIEKTTPLADAVSRESARGPVALLWEEMGRSTPGLRDALGQLSEGHSRARLAIVVGPVGGFEAGEVEEAKAAGATVIGFGSRILKSETAAIAALSAAMFELGELGGGV